MFFSDNYKAKPRALYKNVEILDVDCLTFVWNLNTANQVPTAL